MFTGCEEDVAGSYGHYVEECEDEFCGEDEMALWIAFFGVGGGRDGG